MLLKDRRKQDEVLLVLLCLLAKNISKRKYADYRNKTKVVGIVLNLIHFLTPLHDKIF